MTRSDQLTLETWQEAQRHETGFWQSQHALDNEEQRQRNVYYRGALEAECRIFEEFFTGRDFSRQVLVDVGSGPQGILHVLHAARKIAVDPLMVTFRAQGYEVDADGVTALAAPGEVLAATVGREIADVVFCLNALDHARDPSEVVRNIVEVLRPRGELLLLTDLRTQGQLDGFHRLALTEGAILDCLSGLHLVATANIPHGAGNPVRQLVVRARKDILSGRTAMTREIEGPGVTPKKAASIIVADCCGTPHNYIYANVDGKWVQLVALALRSAGGKTDWVGGALPAVACQNCGKPLNSDTPTRRHHPGAFKPHDDVIEMLRTNGSHAKG